MSSKTAKYSKATSFSGYQAEATSVKEFARWLAIFIVAKIFRDPHGGSHEDGGVKNGFYGSDFQTLTACITNVILHWIYCLQIHRTFDVGIPQCMYAFFSWFIDLKIETQNNEFPIKFRLDNEYKSVDNIDLAQQVFGKSGFFRTRFGKLVYSPAEIYEKNGNPIKAQVMLMKYVNIKGKRVAKKVVKELSVHSNHFITLYDTGTGDDELYGVPERGSSLSVKLQRYIGSIMPVVKLLNGNENFRQNVEELRSRLCPTNNISMKLKAYRACQMMFGGEQSSMIGVVGLCNQFKDSQMVKDAVLVPIEALGAISRFEGVNEPPIFPSVEAMSSLMVAFSCLQEPELVICQTARDPDNCEEIVKAMREIGNIGIENALVPLTMSESLLANQSCFLPEADIIGREMCYIHHNIWFESSANGKDPNIPQHMVAKILGDIYSGSLNFIGAIQQARAVCNTMCNQIPNVKSAKLVSTDGTAMGISPNILSVCVNSKLDDKHSHNRAQQDDAVAMTAMSNHTMGVSAGIGEYLKEHLPASGMADASTLTDEDGNAVAPDDDKIYTYPGLTLYTTDTEDGDTRDKMIANLDTNLKEIRSRFTDRKNLAYYSRYGDGDALQFFTHICRFPIFVNVIGDVTDFSISPNSNKHMTPIGLLGYQFVFHLGHDPTQDIAKTSTRSRVAGLNNPRSKAADILNKRGGFMSFITGAVDFIGNLF